jgi:hypothetical protein
MHLNVEMEPTISTPLNSKEYFVLLHPVQNSPDNHKRRAAVEQGLTCWTKVVGRRWLRKAEQSSQCGDETHDLKGAKF